MKNCKVCDKSLEGATKSAAKENGDFYIVCNGCGQVYYVSHDENGLTTVKKTLAGHNKKAYDQMKEAKKLLNAAGVGVYSFKDDIHSEFKKSSELEETKAEDQEEEASLNEKDTHFIDKFTLVLKSVGINDYPRERMEQILLTIKKNPKLTFDELTKEVIRSKMLRGEKASKEEIEEKGLPEDCDCEDCELSFCENHPSNQEEEDYDCNNCEEANCGSHPSNQEVESEIGSDKYIVEVEKDGESIITFSKDKDSLIELIEANSHNVKIISIHELKPVKIEKTISYTLG